MREKAEQIRSDYSLSIYTVRNHIQRVYRKLNVHSALELQDFVKEYISTARSAHPGNLNVS